jgi:SWI/SNF-related matrix-associated actin-dependent regulator 1 of chromatin subfamily A
VNDLLHKRKPFSHQIEAAAFLIHKKRAILADDMGAGKTLSAILAMQALSGKKLIVCPASLKLNWKKEIQLVSEDPIVMIDGSKWLKVSRNSWVIINYDILKNHMTELKKASFKVVAFDEAHYCKSINNNGHGGSKRARYFIQLANAIEHVFLLTGTPITNKTKDIFNMLKAIKHPLSKNFKDFAKQYCAPVMNGFGWSYDGSSNQEELNEKIQSSMMRRLKEDLLELPIKTRSFIPVDIPLRKYEVKVEDYMRNRPSLHNKGDHLVYLNAMRHILADEKVKHTITLAENLLDQGKPTVIFTNYHSVVDALKLKFKKAVTITGKDSKEARQNAIQAFQTGKVDLIICNLIAGGVGITLTRAKNMLINDFDWVPTNHTQAEERIYRIGQDENVLIEYLYSEGTIDEKMSSLLEDKLLNINKIIDDKEEGFLEQIITWFQHKKLAG